MCKCFLLQHHKRMTTTSHYLLFWQHTIHLIQLTCWKARAPPSKPRDDKWGTKLSWLQLVHHVSQEVRPKGEDIFHVADRKKTGHQNGFSRPLKLQATESQSTFPPIQLVSARTSSFPSYWVCWGVFQLSISQLEKRQPVFPKVWVWAIQFNMCFLIK